MKLQTVRGTRDLLGDEAQLFAEIEELFCATARVYDFQKIETPIFEFTSVFQRTLGDQSDIVNKEMYTFEDRSGDSLTLRPEGTASVARAAISNSLLRDLPLKLFYSGPMFRHERPQKGRYRQFQQFGVELLGVDKPVADLEVIAFAWDFFKACQLDQRVQLEINTIGDRESREAYREALISYFEKFSKDLSEESQKRLKTNPLRILDSKDEKDKKIVDGAPEFSNYLNPASTRYFDEILSHLNRLNLSYHLNPRLVRGLDYYDHCVFEFTTSDLGSQNAVLSGGRYNHLIESMGGPATPGVGWAAGMDRLALMIGQPRLKHQTVALITASPGVEAHAIEFMQTLRQQKVPCQMIYNGNISKQLKKADKRNCSHALVIGESEIKEQKFMLKELASGEQKEFSKSDLIEQLKKYYG